MIQSSIKLIKTREYIPRAANLTEILLLKKWVLDLVDKKIVELEQEKKKLDIADNPYFGMPAK